MRHALGSGIRVEGVVGDRWHWRCCAGHEIARFRGGACIVTTRARIGEAVGRLGGLQLLRKGLGQLLGIVGEFGQLWGNSRCGLTLALQLGLPKGLSLPAAFA